MRITIRIILVTFILLPLLGCSHETEAGSNTYTFKDEGEGTIYTISDSLLIDASSRIWRDSFVDYLDDNVLSMPTTIDLDYLIDEGYLAIIPKNPYTGEDVKQSEDYSPGDVYFKFNFFEGGEFKVHYGKGSLSYQPEMYAKGEVEEIWSKVTPKSNEEYIWLSYDGRTRTHFIIWYNMYKDEIEEQPPPRTQRTKTDDATQRMFLIMGQIGDVLRYAPEIMDQPGDTLMDIVNTFGRINPAGWINPYTGMPMKEVPIWEQMEIPDLINRAVNLDKEEYAGNYSYVKFEWEGHTWGTLAFYYIKKNDELWVDTYNIMDHEKYEQVH